MNLIEFVWLTATLTQDEEARSAFLKSGLDLTRAQHQRGQGAMIYGMIKSPPSSIARQRDTILICQVL